MDLGVSEDGNWAVANSSEPRTIRVHRLNNLPIPDEDRPQRGARGGNGFTKTWHMSIFDLSLDLDLEETVSQ